MCVCTHAFFINSFMNFIQTTLAYPITNKSPQNQPPLATNNYNVKGLHPKGHNGGGPSRLHLQVLDNQPSTTKNHPWSLKAFSNNQSWSHRPSKLNHNFPLFSYLPNNPIRIFFFFLNACGHLQQVSQKQLFHCIVHSYIPM